MDDRAGVAIGLDLGTSGLRAALVDEVGDAVAFVAVPMAATERRQPQAWWRVAQQAIAALRKQADLSSVRALAVDGTSGTILPVNAAGEPLTEASLYNDRADPDFVSMVGETAAEDSAARGATSPLARLLVWRNLPGVARILHEADWLTGQFSGRFDTTDANNALKTGFDPRGSTWPTWVSNLAGDILPCVVAAGTPLDRLLPEVAIRLGLPPTALIVAGTTDGCAGFLATGAAQIGDAVTSLGSTLTIKLLSDAPVFSPLYGIYSHVVRGQWLAGGASNSGGVALLHHFEAAALVRLSERIDPARDSPLDYYPLPGRGERFPIADPAMVPRETPRPADDAAFLHGLLQGIANIEAIAYSRLAELGAPPLRSLRTIGGGGRNAAWTAIRARRLGIEMTRPRSEEAAIGTAGLALAA